jgi:hypothetical protein
MYSGHLLEQLVEMVARAEEHAREMKTADAEAVRVYAQAFGYETGNQRALAGVA